ncbi:hypothetical protein CONLIGDRAFT_700614 [Coniochaeta ligniaria NRRL 30616]|uniref:Uncharacterized protein n=1 Tax=Coniochaeta ligniaria NRRL 30616 TaxID=1408157 RepID=A0A1J7JNP7_9PEZI|nr:hypothetical protein CONLIGDRAFT_700614 [Coniochaeta ligniaria NRRL 30616]
MSAAAPTRRAALSNMTTNQQQLKETREASQAFRGRDRSRQCRLYRLFQSTFCGRHRPALVEVQTENHKRAGNRTDERRQATCGDNPQEQISPPNHRAARHRGSGSFPSLLEALRINKSAANVNICDSVVRSWPTYTAYPIDLLYYLLSARLMVDVPSSPANGSIPLGKSGILRIYRRGRYDDWITWQSYGRRIPKVLVDKGDWLLDLHAPIQFEDDSGQLVDTVNEVFERSIA